MLVNLKMYLPRIAGRYLSLCGAVLQDGLPSRKNKMTGSHAARHFIKLHMLSFEKGRKAVILISEDSGQTRAVACYLPWWLHPCYSHSAPAVCPPFDPCGH